MNIQEYAISGSAYYLSKVFCSDYEFIIPSYQRPYSWETTHIEQLFDDLYEAYCNRKDEAYFLGSLVIIKKDSPLSEVVDGQQRLTSLTILISSLAYFLKDEKLKATALRYIQQSANEFENIDAKPILTLRDKDNKFFREYVQNLNFDKLLDLDITKDCKNDAQRNIVLNSKSILNKIKSVFDGVESATSEFLKFIIQKCCLIIVSSSNQKSAFRIFSIMNNRGLDLLPIDIIKADLIGKLSADNQENYTEKWEDLEQTLGRSKFNELFTHLRMIKRKNKMQQSVLEEWQEHLLPDIKSIETFIDEELSDYAENFNILKKREYKASQNQEKINKLLGWLNRTNFSEWIPVALLFLHKKPNHQKILDFFIKLDCLTSFLFLNASNVNERIKRYSEVLDELDKLNEISDLPSSLSLSEKEKDTFNKLLDGNIYELVSARRNYIILRTDAAISDGNATYQGILTIEHVLPQKIGENSKWRDDWNEEDHKNWIHRLANLVPLNKRRNSAASNLDFDQKKKKYFKGNSNVSSYVMTTQVLNEDKWIPSVLENRQHMLLKKLIELWQID